MQVLSSTIRLCQNENLSNNVLQRAATSGTNRYAFKLVKVNYKYFQEKFDFATTNPFK